MDGFETFERDLPFRAVSREYANLCLKILKANKVISGTCYVLAGDMAKAIRGEVKPSGVPARID
jgi:hypothetical protein